MPSCGSLFTGIGGIDLAFENQGFHSAYQVEIDSHATSVLERHFPDVPRFTDITEVQSSELPNVDVLHGGFPCVDISVAGRRAGLAGSRSGLWWEYHRILRDTVPEWCVIENVVGLLSSGQRRDLGAILGALGDLGYGYAYRVLDARWFGVPQRRRRVVIVGHIGDASGPAKVLLEPESGGGDIEKGKGKGKTVASLSSNGIGASGPDDNQAQAGHLIEDVAVLGGGGRRGWCSDVERMTFVPDTAWALQERDWKSADSDTKDGHLLAVAFSENQRAEVVETDYLHSLSVNGGKPGVGYPAIRQGLGVRRLTPLECERLQGFEDGWTDNCSDSQRYKQLGNSVAVPVFEWVAKRMMREIDECT